MIIYYSKGLYNLTYVVENVNPLSVCMFSHRNTSGQVVCHASTEVAKRQVKPFGFKRSVCSAVAPQLWHFVIRRVLRYVRYYIYSTHPQPACCVPSPPAVGHFCAPERRGIMMLPELSELMRPHRVYVRQGNTGLRRWRPPWLLYEDLNLTF